MRKERQVEVLGTQQSDILKNIGTGKEEWLAYHHRLYFRDAEPERADQVPEQLAQLPDTVASPPGNHG